MKNSINLIFFLSITLVCSSQIPIERYHQEISNLETEQEFEIYWQNLNNIDQNILLNAKNNIEFDSISLDNMIKTALMFEIHGTEVYRSNNIVPIMNLSHNYIDQSNLAFWPIIQKCSETGGVIKNFGGEYPAYVLECIVGNFYDYSVFQQELIYPELLNQLNQRSYGCVSSELLAIFENQKALRKLKEVKLLGRWNLQPSKNIIKDRFFEFIEMSDNSIYLKRNNRFQKLVLIKTETDSKIFRIENEPFGWYYKLKPDGNLSLLDSQNTVLIDYKRV